MSDVGYKVPFNERIFPEDIEFGSGPSGLTVKVEDPEWARQLVASGKMDPPGTPKQCERAINPKRVYIIGSLRNPEVPILAEKLRKLGVEVFDDWFAAGPEADDYWQKYETYRNRSYKEALDGAAAKNVYAFDKRHLDEADAVILLMPAGKSGHLELGYCCGKGKKTAVYFPETFTVERYDVMYQFANFIAENEKEIIEWVRKL